jgi:hypothetical protein
MTITARPSRELSCCPAARRVQSAASYADVRGPPCDIDRVDSYAGFISRQELSMGKYIIAWILGVPAIVLVVAYFFFH